MSIIYDARKIKAYDRYRELGEYSGLDKKFLEELWIKMILDEELMEEFMYFVDNHTFKDKKKCQGMALTDLYVWQIRKFNVSEEIGKNPECCNKIACALLAMNDMLLMEQDPDGFINRMIYGSGMDMM